MRFLSGRNGVRRCFRGRRRVVSAARCDLRRADLVVRLTEPSSAAVGQGASRHGLSGGLTPATHVCPNCQPRDPSRRPRSGARLGRKQFGSQSLQPPSCPSVVPRFCFLVIQHCVRIRGARVQASLASAAEKEGRNTLCYVPLDAGWSLSLSPVAEEL